MRRVRRGIDVRTPSQGASEVRRRHLCSIGALALGVALASPQLSGSSADQAKPPAARTAKPWTTPRTPDGKPDLQGNWSNATLTPLERMGKDGLILTEEAAAAI